MVSDEDEFDDEPLPEWWPIPECITSAQDLSQERKYLESAAAFRDALQILEHPELIAQAYRELSNALYYHAKESGSWKQHKKEIVYCLKKSTELGFINSFWELGRRLSHMGEHEEAVVVLRKVVNDFEVDRKSFQVAIARVALASSLLNLGRVSEALEVGHFISSQSWFHWDSSFNQRLVLPDTVQLAYEVMLAGFEKLDPENYLKAHYEQLLNEVLNYRAGREGRIIERILPLEQHGAIGQLENGPEPSITMNNPEPVQTQPTTSSRIERLLGLVRDLNRYDHACQIEDMRLVNELIERAGPLFRIQLVQALELVVDKLVSKEKTESAALKTEIDKLKQQIKKLEERADSHQAELSAAQDEAAELRRLNHVLKMDNAVLLKALAEEKGKRRR